MSVDERKAQEMASKARLAYNDFKEKSKWLEERGFTVSVGQFDDVLITKTNTINL